MNRNVTVITVGVIVLVLIGAITLASIRDGNTERLVMFFGSILAAIPALFALNKAEQTKDKVERMQSDVTEVKHQTNGKLTELVATVQEAVATNGTEDPGRHAADSTAARRDSPGTST